MRLLSRAGEAVRRTLRGCPPGWQLTRAVSQGAASGRLEAHLLGCARCASEHQALRDVVGQAASLRSSEGMSHASRQAIAARLLSVCGGALTERRRSFPALLAGLAAAASIALAVVATRPRDPVAPPVPAQAAAQTRASISAVGAARFARVRPPPDELVRLEEGSIVLEVTHLPPGERFRVQTDDGEVEVHGTRFEVTASNRKLVAVSVSKGRVAIASPSGAAAVLDAGDEWVASRSAAAPAEVPPPAPPKAAVAVSSPRAARASFDRAWSRLREGRAREAASSFAEVERLASDRGIKEDALYWRAVATARAGDPEAARRLFAEFLGRFPSASRRGEAATALGWLLLDAGEIDEAARAFDRGAKDRSPNVRESALEGLRRVGRR
jgi:TolA-binding protein